MKIAHWIAAVFVGCGIIWDYDYMRHWKKKVEMGKTDGWGHVRTCSPGRCPGRVLNGYSMGTQWVLMWTHPFFKYPRQNITMSFLTQPLKSASSSGASFFAQRRARNQCDWWRRARSVFSSRLPLRTRGGFKVIMALMSVYVSRANFTTKARLWTKFFASAFFVHEYSFQNKYRGNSCM